MSSSKKPKQQVADYLMSLHVGVAYELDAIKRIRVADKDIWNGRMTTNGTISINNPGLFGGNKKEGGVRGLVEVLLGGVSQVLPDRLVAKLGQGADGTPGFRGISSLFFSGGGAEGGAGFMWGSNSPYMRAIDVTAERAPKGFYPLKALIPDGIDTPATVDVIAEVATPYVAGAPIGSTPRPAYIDAGKVVFHAFQWTSGSPTLPTSWHKYTITQTGLLSDEVIPEAGPISYYPPADGRSDSPDKYWKNRSYFSGGGSEPSTSVGKYAERGSVRAFLYSVFGGAKYLGLPLNPSTGVQPAVSVPGADALAIGTDGNIYVALPVSGAPTSVEIRVYNGTTSTLVSASVVTGLLGGSGEWDDLCVEGGSVYVAQYGSSLGISGGAIFDTVWRIETSNWTFSERYDTPGGTGAYQATTSNRSFRVLGNTIIFAYASYTSQQLIVRWVRTVGATYKRVDANPAHIIFECLTNNDWGLGLPTSMIDTTSFTAAADTLYAEGLGLSMMWATQSSIEDFINDVLSHIDGTYGVDPSTGKIYLSLVRGGYSTSGLHNLNPDNCKVTRFQRKSLSETSNEVTVTWTNPENEQEETVTAHDLANYGAQGRINSNASNYYGVRKADLAARLALRDLTRGAAPLASFEADVDRTGWSFKPGDIVSLTYPEYGLNELPVRVMSVDYGRPGASKVKVSLLEDVFSTPATAYVDVSGTLTPSDIDSDPEPLQYFQGATAPYYFVSRELGSADAQAVPVDSGFTALLGASPNIIDIEITSPESDALGNISYVSQGVLSACGWAKLAAPVTIEDFTASALISGFTGSVSPAEGVFVWIGTSAANCELAIITSVGAGLSLKRGLLDTSPKAWPANTPLWFMANDTDVTDAVEHLVGLAVDFRLLPRARTWTLDPDWSPVYTVAADNRQHRPYRPANVQINGSYWPTSILTPVSLTFARRNRLTEEPVVLGWKDGDVTPEAGQTVTATLRRVDTNAVLAETTGITGTTVTLDPGYVGPVTLTLTSVRDGLTSYQPFVHTFTVTDTRALEDGEARITEDGEARELEAS